MDGITDLDMSLSKLWETVKDREAWHTAVHGVSKSRTSEQLNQNTIYGVINIQSIEKKRYRFHP